MPREDQITYLGKVNARGRGTLFGIKRADRRSHMYVIGRTGTGKSTLLSNMIRQDIANGEGLAVFDPHGDLVDGIVRQGTPRTDLLCLDLSRSDLDIGFNPLEGIPEEKRPLAAANLVEIFKKIWSDSWGPRLEHVLRNAILALLDKEGATLADIPRLFGDGAFRAAVSRTVRNAQVRSFWAGEYERYPPSMRAQVTAPVENKVGAFLADPSPTSTVCLSLPWRTAGLV